MSKAEVPEFLRDTLRVPKKGAKELAVDHAKAIARTILPEDIKNRIRDRIYGMPHLPFKEPQLVQVNGISALFNINTSSDYYRLMRQDYEGPFTRELIESLKIQGEKGVFMDIGCAQGLYSILAAKIVGRVIAIEPNPFGVAELRENAKVNGPEVENKLTILEIAAGDKSGVVDLQVNPTDSYAALVINYQTQSTTVQVRMMTVDELINSGETEVPTAVKIDVEGAEGMVINGMQKLLSSSSKPNDLFVEFHPLFLKKFDTCIEVVGNQILEFGYKPIVGWKRGNEILVHFTQDQN